MSINLFLAAIKDTNKTTLNHIISFVLVSAILISLFFYFENIRKEVFKSYSDQVQKWANLNFINFDDPMHRALVEDALNIYQPAQPDKNEELIQQIKNYRDEQIAKIVGNTYLNKPFSYDQFSSLLGMYSKFILVYIITLVLTWYGVQTLGTYRFVKFRQNQRPYLEEFFSVIDYKNIKNGRQFINVLLPAIVLLIKAAIKAIMYLILFSPAYVLAYSFRTKFDTDMLVFMILLSIISNAVLITYTHKFYTFLISESRKGYVETARVKNMHNSYASKTRDGISLKMILRWKKHFPGHVFEHIYENARFQYLATIKEQASFLITGLIIIEMALNIQDHLCYELLQNILYENYAVVTLIVLGIYYIVKATDVFVDRIILKESLKYSNNF
jgi:hypothetical protein